MTDGVTKKKGPSARLSVAVLVIGFALVLGGVYQAFRVDSDDLDPTLLGDAPTEIRLREGTYYVYEEFTNDRRGESDAFSVTPADIVVRARDGRVVPTAVANSADEIWNGSAVRRPAVKFTTAAAGLYVISSTDVYAAEVRRAPFEAFADSMPWFRLSLAGGAVMILGLVLLVVGAFRRRSTVPALITMAPPPPGPAAVLVAPGAPSAPVGAGWHADPWRQATWRYHDGSGWTGHVR